MRLTRPALVYGIAIAAAFIISLNIFIFFNNGLSRRVLFFPYGDNLVAGENRQLMDQETKEDDISTFIQELILGPVQINYDTVFPKGTELQSLVYADKTVFMDFSDEIVTNPHHMSLEKILVLLERNIRYNFKDVRDLHVTINGEIPKL